LSRDREATLERMAEAGRHLIEAKGADCLVLGCMSSKRAYPLPR
jgi:hypothetical protein